MRLPEGLGEVVTPYPPTPIQSLMFYCDHPIAMGRADSSRFDVQPSAIIVGPQFSRVNIKVIERLRAIRVDFLPGGMFRLLGIPMHELFDKGLDAEDFFSTELKAVNEQLRNSDLETGKNAVEKFLLDKLSKLKESHPFDGAVQQMLIRDHQMTIEQAASLACLSLKQFERKCKERVGMNPKTFSRIIRFSKAYRLHETFPNLSWIDIAYQTGYFDQMHMIRDFREFAGVNPSIIEKQLLSTPFRMQRNLLL